MRESYQSAGAAAGPLWEAIRPRRHLSLLGGTVSFSECLTALRYLVDPFNLVDGDAVTEYEGSFARTVGVRHAVSFCTGRVGFFGLLRALGVGPGDEVLLQAPTHVVVPNAVRYTGARPVYVDCLAGSYNMDLADAERKITSRTRVLLLQHTFGIPATVHEASALASRHRLCLIEDCVHALGARYDGRMLGSFGRAAFFSTEETKTISTTMGGMVVTDDGRLAQLMRSFQRSCPPPPAWLAARYLLKLLMYYLLAQPHLHYYARAAYELCGKRLPLPRPTARDELIGRRPEPYEQRLSNAQAAVGVMQLSQLERNLAHRREIAAIYTKGLAPHGFRLPAVPQRGEAAFVRFPVWVADRDTLVRLCAPYLVLGTWFTSVLEEAVAPEYGDYVTGTCPQAEEVAEHLVNLPTHPRVTVADAERFVQILAGVAETQAGPLLHPEGMVQVPIQA